VGVDPRSEADAVIADLQLHGFRVGRRVEENDFVAFDAARAPESTVRIVTSRGPAFAVQVPDARWPERILVELGPSPRPDFDRDGRRDVVVAIGEEDRTCLAWLQVDVVGFVSEVVRPSADWGELPCVTEIDPDWPRLLLEVSVPNAPVPGARVRFPVKATARRWVLDESPAAAARWDNERERRNEALEAATLRGDVLTADRLQSELDWLEQLRKAKEPVLEPAGDVKEAR
jgi:hypothetical protein